MRLYIKIAVASLAFVPMAAFFLGALQIAHGILTENIIRYVQIGGWIFNLPAFGIASSIQQAFNLSKSASELCLLVCMLLWSSFMAWIFWQIVKEFLGENEPEYETNPQRAKYDWAGFRVRFFFGFILGFLFGWRFVRDTTSLSVMLAAMTIVGLLVGLVFGLYRPNFWSRF